MNTTTVLNCNCVHEFQDQRYGRGMRLANRMKQSEGDKLSRWRCTVCGNVHDRAVTQSQEDKDKDKKDKKKNK